MRVHGKCEPNSARTNFIETIQAFVRRTVYMNWMNAVLLGCGLAVAGCGTSREYRSADVASDKAYKKGKIAPDLKESEVLGIKRESASNEDIQRILDEKSAVALKPGSTVLLVQSGTANPDKEMFEQLSKHFTVIPYTGIPSDLRAEADGSVSKALRLAAAHAKAESIVVYWGSLELKRDDLPTGIVSWVPVVDFMVPDEYQKVRMHLKVALIDVRTGQWATFRTEPLEEQMLTTRYAREKAPNWPLGPYKSRVYERGVKRLVDGYTDRG
jgi:hypothetical protein